MLQGRNRRIALNAAMAQATATAIAVVRMDMQPHRIGSRTGCPALWAELQCPRLLDCDAFNDGI